jgi:hypothetical protein
MKQKLFILILLFTSLSFANEDVCCIFGGATGSGDSVQTFARITPSLDCKAGGSFQGKKICASIADPDNSYCGGGSTYQDRCGKCGFFWSGKECLTTDPKEKAKKELKEEEEKKKAEKKDGAKPSDDKAATVKPVQVAPVKPADPDNPNVKNAIPEEDSLYNRKSKGINEN